MRKVGVMRICGSKRENVLSIETFTKFRFTLIFATSRKINTMILIYFQNLKN